MLHWIPYIDITDFRAVLAYLWHLWLAVMVSRAMEEKEALSLGTRAWLKCWEWWHHFQYLELTTHLVVVLEQNQAISKCSSSDKTLYKEEYPTLLWEIGCQLDEFYVNKGSMWKQKLTSLIIIDSSSLWQYWHVVFNDYVTYYHRENRYVGHIIFYVQVVELKVIQYLL